MVAHNFIQVVLNSIGFEGQIADFSRTGADLKSSTSEVSNPSSCQGLVLTDWVERVRDVGELISLYKQLIEKDVSSLKDTKKAIEEADRERARDILDKVSGVMDSANNVIRKTVGQTGNRSVGITAAGAAVTGVIRSSHVGSVVSSAGAITGAPLTGGTAGRATGFVSGSVGRYVTCAGVGAAHGFVANHYTVFGGGKGGGGIR